MSIGQACHAANLCVCVLFPFVSADNDIEGTVRLQSAAAGGTMNYFSEAPLNGAELRCSKPDQTAAQFVRPEARMSNEAPGKI